MQIAHRTHRAAPDPFSATAATAATAGTAATPAPPRPLTARSAALAALLLGLLAALVLPAAPPVAAQGEDPAEPLRVATFNASLNRAAEGELVADLSTPDDPQAAAVAAIIQQVRPDVLLLNEIDYVEGGQAVDLFREHYLEVPQGGGEPITYPHAFVAPSNTGVPSGFDLNRDGEVGGPDDALGFGAFPGQYGMAVLSRHPIDADAARTFADLRWADMPDARLPVDPETGEPWYEPEALEVLPLSSKSHWDVPIEVGGEVVHLLASHPTPPVFDGPEDRNGLRNADEIRFWADYVTPERSGWITDDQGRDGGLAAGSRFVIAGDLNSDPFDGDSLPGAAQQVLLHPAVNTDLTPTSPGGVEQAALQGDVNDAHVGDPAYDTADFAEPPGNVRADYVLPSRTLGMVDAGVWWPTTGDPAFEPVGEYPFPSSDHRLVWIDVVLDPSAVGTPDLPAGDPIAAALDVSAAAFGDAAAPVVVIGRSDAFADSLAGSVLAGEGPLLLTPPDALDEDVRAEVARVLAADGEVLLLGGEQALAPEVEQALVADGHRVRRLQGPTRVETAVAVAEAAEERFGAAGTVALARADAPADQPTAAWADAVAAGGWAAATGQPVLLTPSGELHPAVAAFLAEREAEVVGLGGTAALADAVLEAAGTDRRVAGSNRYATAAAVAAELYPDGPRRTFTVADGASADGWAYLLPASALAAADGTALLLIEPDRVPAETTAAVCRSGGPARTTLVGEVAAEVAAALRTC